MSGPLLLAIKYVAHNKLKSLILMACIFLTALLPIAIKLLLLEFNQKILERSSQTPIVIGAAGSSLDLTLHTLYFKSEPPGTLLFAEVARIRETGLAEPIPVQAKFTARKFPIVGTTVDYFDFRNLVLESGTSFAMLGDCVIGATIAHELKLKTGDQLLSDRENVVDIAGLYPLKMRIAGVLAKSQTPDDLAVFVDLKTSWIIQGLGHGHQDLVEETDEGKILARSNEKIIASAAVLPYTEVTEENMSSFHFHGEVDQFPITAIIAIPADIKSATLLQGQYDVGSAGLQFVRPLSVVEELMNMVFRIKLFFDANAILIAISTLLLLFLVIMLSLRLRKREMETMFKLGSSRGTIAWLQIWEMVVIFSISALLVLAVSCGIWAIAGELVETLLLSSSTNSPSSL